MSKFRFTYDDIIKSMLSKDMCYNRKIHDDLEITKCIKTICSKCYILTFVYNTIVYGPGRICESCYEKSEKNDQYD